MSKLRCAVIGLGMGSSHARSYALHPEAKLVGLCDLNTDLFPAFADIIPAQVCFTDYRELLEKTRPDIVSIALPNALHEPVTVACLQAGAHVLCEKPPAMNLEQALRMRDTAERTGKTLGINFSQRFRHPAIKQIAASGECGDFYHAKVAWTRRDGAPRFGGWFGQKALSGGGPLIDLGVHRIDLALWLMGSPQAVSASAGIHGHIGADRAAERNKLFDVEDFSAGFIRTSSNATLLFEASWIGHQMHAERQQMELLGTRAALEQQNNLWWKHGADSSGYYSRTLVPAQPTDPNSVEAFVAAISAGKPFAAPIEDGLKIQAILDALYLSAETGREVEIPSLNL